MRFTLSLLFILQLLVAQSAVSPEVVLTTGHNDQINVMTVSLDHKYLASAANNKIIKIWDIASNREYRTISGTDGRINQLVFSSDNKSLVGTTEQGELIIWDVITGKREFETQCNSGFKGTNFYNNGEDIVFLNSSLNMVSVNLKTQTENVLSKDIYVVSMVVDKVNQIVYCMGIKGEMIYFDLKTKSVTKTLQVFDEVKFTYTTARISSNGRYIVNAYGDDKIRVFDTKLDKFIYQSPKYKAKIMTFEMDAVEPLIYFTLHTGEVIFFNFLTKKKVHSYKDDSFIANCMATYPTGKVLLVANYNVIKFIDTEAKREFKRFEPKIGKVLNMAYDQQGKYLAVASDKVNIQIWDLRRNKIITTLQGFFPCEFSPDGTELYSMSYTTNLAVWDVETWEKKKELKTEYELIQEMAFSPDGKYVAGSGYNQVIKIWDRESGELIKKLNGHTGGVLTLDFHPTKPILASGSHDETVRIWDFLSEKELHQFTDQTIVVSGVKFSPDGNHLASSAWDKTICVRNTSNWEVEHILKGHTNSIMGVDYNKDGTVIMSYAGNNSVSEADNSVMFWDAKEGTQIAKIQDHEGGITKAFFDLDADYVFSSSDDGTIKICDYKKKKTIATFIAIGKSEFMIYTPDNYYMASRNALSSVAFRIDGELVPFEQFDIYLNRPDIVAKEIGKTSDNLIKAYNYIYKKRLRKYNIDEGSINLDYHIPKLLNETSVPLITSEKSIKVNVKFWDEKYNLSQINVYVNGTPIYGETGFRIKGEIKSYRKTLTIPLLDETNKIQISCINDNGAESLYESFEIVKEKGTDKSDLYIVSIGVSNYQDEKFKLKYPTKDAKDMVATLADSNGLYNKVYTKMLLDEQAILENFIELEKFFENCKHTDIAIIFIAGHGVLDANFDYFFGTYDMDFNNPAERGLPYDRIHALLNKIKAYRKLLIMDTCHSGELDKEDIEQGPDPEVDDSDIEFRGGTLNLIGKNAFGSENTIELTKDLFSDTRKGSGATVISSAGGAEYAMESDKWHNGLFTFAFLTGFEMKTNMFNIEYAAADFNENGTVEVSEIRDYVNKKVSEMSGGKQIPSSREENISQDYAIFVK